nr:hypothetical protein [Tanacetum cinerariifolium]
MLGKGYIIQEIALPELICNVDCSECRKYGWLTVNKVKDITEIEAFDVVDIPPCENLQLQDLVEFYERWEKVLKALGILASRFEAIKIETEKNAASGSTIIDENRGRDDARQNPKKRGTYKDVVTSLDKRVVGVETSMTELKTQVEGLEGLDIDFTSMREIFRVALDTLSGDLKREIHDLRDLFMGEISKIREDFGEEVSTLHQNIEELHPDVALCKRSLASRGSNPNHDQSWMFLNHHRLWESERLWWLMISYGRWSNT